MPGGGPSSTADLLARWSALLETAPEAPVLHGPRGPVRRAEIQAQAEELAASLPADLPEGAVVGLQAADGAPFLAGLLAIWRRGAVALLLDADLPGARVTELLEELGAWGLCRPGQEQLFASLPDSGPRARLPELACLKLSSGSTGRARGIQMRAAALAADAEAVEAAMGIGPGDRVMVAVPMSFSYGFGNLVLPALLAGRELVLPEPGLPTDILVAARRHGATVLPTVPFFLDNLLRRAAAGPLPESLRLVVSAGAPLGAATAQAFLDRFDQPVHVFYGASEAGGICFDAGGEAGLVGRVGRPLPGVELRLEAEDAPVAVRSPALYSGYWPAPANTAEPGWYRPGDRGRWEAGELRLLGRDSHLLNLGGYKLDPLQVAGVIEGLAGVRAAHVTALHLPGRALPSCCALVERDRASLDASAVQEHCRRMLPAMQRPRRLRVVDRIPRNGRGKVEAATVRRLLVEADSSAE